MTSKFEGVPCVALRGDGDGHADRRARPARHPRAAGRRRRRPDQPTRPSTTPTSRRSPRSPPTRSAVAPLGAELRERARLALLGRSEMAKRHGEIYDAAGRGAAGRRDRDAAAAARADPLPRPARRSAKPLVSVLIPHLQPGALPARMRRLGAGADLPERRGGRRRRRLHRRRRGGGARRARAAWTGSTVRAPGRERRPEPRPQRRPRALPGRYILPLDSDNLLLPGRDRALVEQLNSAGEDIGFIYPNLDYFGNREEYHEAPPYNLYTLLHAQLLRHLLAARPRRSSTPACATTEEIQLGHEDWEFVLRLAAHGVRGEPARDRPSATASGASTAPTSSITHPVDFREDVLVGEPAFRGREAEIKAQESPALSIVALAPVDRVNIGARPDLPKRWRARAASTWSSSPRFRGRWPGSVRPGLRRAPRVGDCARSPPRGLD